MRLPHLTYTQEQAATWLLACLLIGSGLGLLIGLMRG